ncbi:heparan-alpha-glucosaminide N-acetyltransferase domain-containing protein [[Clostridium] polysaccharolyticum]|uniref:Heparan-alpha-glucosaminide N-acetyltransferase catalytic domain-containing protein n=1 Tax=[Clostridium] polysaccharolyticum TaxID=29364 RepID=A0A1H9Y5E7_9FIRM|nr:heparan-alpha-glucosaminide N-acetyltransferase domain-containing protein [[Clostridium] polysaccharolyticum]SES63994.1 Protein of unknown function [[Clostridium] polysaccharolyticum]
MNQKRQLEIDIVKGYAILFMVLVHCYEDYGSAAIQTKGFFSHLVFFLGGPLTPPVFMFCMGVGMVYTHKQSSRQFIKRGIFLFFLGYVLNFIRDFIPYTIQSYIQHDTSLFETAKDYLLCTDILPFAGLSYLFIGVFKSTRLKDYWLIVFYAFCAILNVILLPFKFETRTLASITGLIWGTWDCTWFPFLSWIFFPISGYLFGKQLITYKDTDQFYRKILTFTGLLFFPLITLMYELHIDCGALDGYFDMEYFHMNWFGNFMTLELILLWTGFWHFASETLPSLLKNTLVRWSKELNVFYIIHWIFIGYGNLVFGYFKHSVIEVLLLFVFTLAASDWITACFIKRRNLPLSKPAGSVRR